MFIVDDIVHPLFGIVESNGISDRPFVLSFPVLPVSSPAFKLLVERVQDTSVHGVN